MEIRRDVIEKETRIETEKEGIMWEGNKWMEKPEYSKSVCD